MAESDDDPIASWQDRIGSLRKRGRISGAALTVVPADEIDVVFQPFQKTRVRAASSEPGTGLGLAICKGIVERHGGRIWVESTAGEGCTFFVTLPAAAMRSASSA